MANQKQCIHKREDSGETNYEQQWSTKTAQIEQELRAKICM